MRVNVEYNQGLFFLHLLQFPRRYAAQIMHRLGERGHGALRLGFEPVIVAVSAGPQRLTDIARLTGMQKQNCTQLIKRIEAAGYLQRLDDPGDRRSQLLGLSAAGETLIHDALTVTDEINAMLCGVVGQPSFEQFRQSIHELCRRLPVAPAPLTGVSSEDGAPGVLFSEISRLARYTGAELNAAVRARGYTEIRPIHEQVLLHLGEGRIRIKAIARENDVSRQAVSAIVNELQEMGYLRLDVDPVDARGRVIALTGKGNTLVEQAAAASDALFQQCQSLLGKGDFEQARQAIADAYHALASRDEVSSPSLELAAYLLAKIKGAVGADGKLDTGFLQALAQVSLDSDAATARLEARLKVGDLRSLDTIVASLSGDR